MTGNTRYVRLGRYLDRKWVGCFLDRHRQDKLGQGKTTLNIKGKTRQDQARPDKTGRVDENRYSEL